METWAALYPDHPGSDPHPGPPRSPIYGSQPGPPTGTPYIDIFPGLSLPLLGKIAQEIARFNFPVLKFPKKCDPPETRFSKMGPDQKTGRFSDFLLFLEFLSR